MNYPAMRRVEQLVGLHSNFLALFTSNLQHLTASIDSDNPTTHWHDAILLKKADTATYIVAFSTHLFLPSERTFPCYYRHWMNQTLKTNGL